MRVLATVAILAALGGEVRAEVDFVREVQPILAEKCTLCHGPDEAKGGLRLTSLEQAVKTLDSGEHAIVPGDAAKSHLLARISATDPDDIMPPPDKGEPLTENEKDILRRWIDAGADWPKHWAYRPLAEPEPPLQGEANPIDQLVSRTLAEKRIEPSPPAPDHVLIRRLFLDLMGLPPTPEQLEDHLPRFRADREAAVARLVDDLLASPRFGERWGRHWLDHARYADSDGYEKDNNRPNAWRYRDWVIDAINEDLPFDQFTIEQFAGDLLPDRTEDQLLATAFHRQTLTNTEGGTDKEQWRVAAVMDRVETMGTVWLGLTVGCARCHTHKYDEITHDEYYRLYAYLNNGDETDARIVHTDEAVERWKTKLADHEKKLAAATTELNQAVAAFSPKAPALAAEMRKQLAAAETERRFTPLALTSIAGPKGVEFMQHPENGAVLVKGDNPDTATYTIEGTLPAGTTMTGLRVEVLPDKTLPAEGPGRTDHGNFVLNRVVLSVDGTEQFFGDGDASHWQEKTWNPDGALDSNAEAGTKGTGWAVGPEFGKAHEAVFGLVRPITAEKDLSFRLELIQNYGSKHTIGKFRLSALVSPTELAAPEDLRKRLAGTPGADFTADFAKWDHGLAALVAKVEDLQKTVPEKPGMNVRVLTERQSDRRTTHVLRRGEFKEPEHEVLPGTLASLPPVSHRGETGDRLDLARWLVNGENPLPPRVVANRIWARLFGEGIVATVDDFGVRGDRPSHPELLDWLAAEFVRLGWSRKELIRTIVSSETYQRSSDHRPDLIDIDPKNLHLARQNRFRVEAETIRDMSLAASGLLSGKIGGPSVFPPIPDGVTDANYNSAFKWETSKGEDRFRRGLYTFFKRTAPHPNLMTFDCPDSNVTNVRRTRSNTPIAALVTLNNETFAETARALARRVVAEVPGDDRARLERAFLLCVARPPVAAETDRLASLLADARAYYRSAPEQAALFAGEGLAADLSPAEAASWTATVRILLNLDEFLVRG